jgi:hypothetical protein
MTCLRWHSSLLHPAASIPREFRQIVVLCQKKGLVAQECHVVTNATLIAADASLNSLIHNDPEVAEKEAVDQQRNRGLKESSPVRRITNQTHTSRTDPDATPRRPTLRSAYQQSLV